LGAFFGHAIGHCDGSSVRLARRATSSRETEAMRRSAVALNVRLTPSLRGSGALSTMLLAHGVLKLAGGALAVAIVVLVNQQLSPAQESACNETVVYNQAPSHPAYVQAELSDTLTEDDDDAVPYRPRAAQIICLLNPNLKEAAALGEPTRLASREIFEQQPMVRVHGFVGFPAKQEPESANLSASPRKPDGGFMNEIDDYLWEVYQRLPIKKDSSGDFSWKDPVAAQRMGMSLQDYVIGGMDPQFREQLYHAGQAMDAAGVQWSILSGFRDDYRQRLASGFKASIGNSLHGGSRRTGGYGHGRAIDITSADGNNPEVVWDWIDQRGAQYGLRRPLPGPDPAHIQQTADTKIAMHAKRMKLASKMRQHVGTKKIKLARAR
jgi:hypothetical protein